MNPAAPFDPDELTKHQRANIKRRQGCTPEDYARAFAHQDGKCACCGGLPKLPSRHLRADTFRKDQRITLVCQPCYDLIETFATHPTAILTYLEASRKHVIR